MSEPNQSGPRELSPDELAWRCPESDLRFETTDELEPLVGTIGQRRAIQALRLGLSLYAPGYNMFVCGISGTRKMETVQEILQNIEPQCALPPDRAYVHNFRLPDQPVLLTFPRGKVRSFAAEMDELVAELRVGLSALQRDEKIIESRQKVIQKYEGKGKEIFRPFEEKAEKAGFTLVQMATAAGLRPELVPLVKGEATSWSDLEEMVEKGQVPPEELERRRESQDDLLLELQQLVGRSMNLGRELRQELRGMVRDLAMRIVSNLVGAVRREWGTDKVGAYLDDVEQGVIEDLDLFMGADGEPEQPESAAGNHIHHRRDEEDPFVEYRVKVVLDASEREGCPIVVEQSPNHQNLFGTVEYSAHKGSPLTNHMRIMAGDILEADGGYLVVDAYDAIMEPGVWTELKRTLLHQKLQLQPNFLGMPMASIRFKPEPIEISTKVVMVGDRTLFQMLQVLDEDFLRVFKVLVDFDDEVDLTGQTMDLLARFVARLAREEGMAPFTRDAVAIIVARAVREAGDRKKFTARLNVLADLMRESNHLRSMSGEPRVGEHHVVSALAGIEDRHNLLEEKVQEAIQREVLLLDTKGARVGVVNGLSVYDIGNYRFGRPIRITGSVSLGRGGILNIERESDLSGSTHDKGVLILSGFLRHRYAQDKPLGLEASLAFEQSYSEVDGDSASSAECYALLSELSGLEVRQDVAVTGSVNQKGDIQAIGGVNEKIEGFFKVCEERGLTGTQGVIIPESNVQHLALRDEVVEAVREGRFHVWAIGHVDEGISLLTGREAGRRGPDGSYPSGSVNALVDEKLTAMADEMKSFFPEFFEERDGEEEGGNGGN